MIKDIKEIKECPECGSSNIKYLKDRQQVICKDCGMIFEPMAKDMEEKFESAAGIKKKK
jgi:transcription initiation factor TFIIIB Brf1 subunit/transcription initiation factor TFIIB